MDVAAINGFIKWCGKIIICVGSVMSAVWLGSKWEKTCEKATSEQRLVGESNFDKAVDYTNKEILPEAAKAIACNITKPRSDAKFSE